MTQANGNGRLAMMVYIDVSTWPKVGDAKVRGYMTDLEFVELQVFLAEHHPYSMKVLTIYARSALSILEVDIRCIAPALQKRPYKKRVGSASKPPEPAPYVWPTELVVAVPNCTCGAFPGGLCENAHGCQQMMTKAQKFTQID